QRERLARRVSAGAGDHRHAPARGLHGRRDHRDVLVDVQRGRFARRPDGDDAVDPVLDLPVDELRKRVEVDVTVAKRCDQRGETTFDRGLRHGDHILATSGPRKQFREVGGLTLRATLYLSVAGISRGTLARVADLVGTILANRYAIEE